MAGEIIAQMIAQASNNVPTDSSDLIFGKVTKVGPLEILVDERYTITQDLMVLMSPVKERVVSFTVNDVSSSSSGSVSYVTNGSFGEPGSPTSKSSATFLTGTSHSSRTIELQIFRNLIVGDKVAMIKGQKNQIYYILDRV